MVVQWPPGDISALLGPRVLALVQCFRKWHTPCALPLICSELVYVALHSIVGIISVDVFPSLCPRAKPYIIGLSWDITA